MSAAFDSAQWPPEANQHHHGSIMLRLHPCANTSLDRPAMRSAALATASTSFDTKLKPCAKHHQQRRPPCERPGGPTTTRAVLQECTHEVSHVMERARNLKCPVALAKVTMLQMSPVSVCTWTCPEGTSPTTVRSMTSSHQRLPPSSGVKCDRPPMIVLQRPIASFQLHELLRVCLIQKEYLAIRRPTSALIWC